MLSLQGMHALWFIFCDNWLKLKKTTIRPPMVLFEFGLNSEQGVINETYLHWKLHFGTSSLNSEGVLILSGLYIDHSKIKPRSTFVIKTIFQYRNEVFNANGYHLWDLFTVKTKTTFYKYHWWFYYHDFTVVDTGASADFLYKRESAISFKT